MADLRNNDVIKIVKDIGGLHATTQTTPYLSLYARKPDFRRQDLEDELYKIKSLGKIRCIRGTIYILSKEMVSFYYIATKKILEKSTLKYLEFHKVSLQEYDVLSSSILSLIKGREMTAKQIRKELNIRNDISSVLYLMCDQCKLIRSRSPRYSLFKEYFPNVLLNGLDEIQAQTILVIQYLNSFAPVTEEDISWWTGLNKTVTGKILKSIHDKIVHVKINNFEDIFISLKSDIKNLEKVKGKAVSIVNFLPSLDPLVMGYKKRDRFLDKNNYHNIFDRSGNATSTILLDGKIIGVWDLEKRAQPLIKLFLFEKPKTNLMQQIYLHAHAVGKFLLEKGVQIEECNSMTPLTKRGAGAVMSPLKGN
jgi:hypothetical protein